MDTTSRTLIPPHVADSAPAAARAVFRLMRKLRHGTLTVQVPDGSSLTFGSGADTGLRAAIRLRNWSPCAAALKSGDIGFAESFIAGDWTTPDLTALLTLFIANRDEVEAMIYGSWWGSLLYRAKHLFNRNSRRGSAKNIHAHYDLGNEFYRLWLDPTMNYSSAWPTPACRATCATKTTATSPTARSTPSHRSRCSRRSGASTGPASSRP
jgi:cyclopropane-fatty-acyl-phospholipid synthase